MDAELGENEPSDQNGVFDQELEADEVGDAGDLFAEHFGVVCSGIADPAWVGGRQEPGQFIEGKEADRLGLQAGLRFAGDDLALVEVGELGELVDGEILGDLARDLESKSGLFAGLAERCLFGGFADVDPAAGEHPHRDVPPFHEEDLCSVFIEYYRRYRVIHVAANYNSFYNSSL